MIIIEAEHVARIKSLSPVIAAMTEFDMKQTGHNQGIAPPSQLELKGCGPMSEIDESRIWGTIKDGKLKLGRLDNLELATLMNFAEYYDMEIIRNYIRIKFYGSQLKEAATAIIHLDTPGVDLTTETKRVYLSATAELCGASTDKLIDQLTKMGENIFEYLVGETRKKIYRNNFGVILACHWCPKKKYRDRRQWHYSFSPDAKLTWLCPTCTHKNCFVPRLTLRTYLL